MAEQKLTNWKNLANYDYLGAYSLQGIVPEITLTIKTIKKERVTATGGASEDCIVVGFEEETKDGVAIKPMVMNKTNCKTISEIYKTPFIEEWIGKKITVYVTKTRFQRDMVDCLRVKNEVPSFKCSVCGKEIEETVYKGSIAKYGKAYCSKECLDKDNDKGE